MAVERTLVLLKPDAVARRLIGELVLRFERRGFKPVAMRFLRATPEILRQHYHEHAAKSFYPQLEEFMSSGPVLALALEGPEAVATIRAMMGATNARQANPGTIRGDYGISRQINLVHGSDSVESAQRELGLWFRPEDFVEWNPVLTELTAAPDELA